MATSWGRPVPQPRRFATPTTRRLGRTGLAAILSVLLLTGCPGVPPPERLAFDTDPRILRGLFVGTVDTRAVPFSMALSGDASLLVAAWPDSVEFWDPEASQLLATVPTTSDGFTSVSGLSVDASGSRVAGILDGNVLVWDGHDGTLVRTFDRRDPHGACPNCGVWSAALAPGGDVFAAGGGFPHVLLVDVASGAVVRELVAVGDRARVVAFSADGALLATASVLSDVRYALRVWETDTYGVVYEREGTVDPSRGAEFAFSADGRRFAVASATRLEVFDLAGGVTALPFDAPSTLWHWFHALSPNGSLAAIGRADEHGSSLDIVEVASGSTVASFPDPMRGQAAVWSADGRYLIADARVVRADDFSVVHDTTTGQLYGIELEATPRYLSARAYAVEGRLRIDGGDPIEFTGVVDGGESQQYLQTHARAPEPATLEIELHGHPWRLHARQVSRRYDYGLEPDEWRGHMTDRALGDDQALASFRLWRAP